MSAPKHAYQRRNEADVPTGDKGDSLLAALLGAISSGSVGKQPNLYSDIQNGDAHTEHGICGVFYTLQDHQELAEQVEKCGILKRCVWSIHTQDLAEASDHTKLHILRHKAKLVHIPLVPSSRSALQKLVFAEYRKGAF